MHQYHPTLFVWNKERVLLLESVKCQTKVENVHQERSMKVTLTATRKIRQCDSVRAMHEKLSLPLY